MVFAYGAEAAYSKIFHYGGDNEIGKGKSIDETELATVRAALVVARSSVLSMLDEQRFLTMNV